MDKLIAAGVAGKMLNLIEAALQDGEVMIEDGVGELPPFRQTNGLAQGDNLSPLLFVVLLSDLPKTINENHDIVYTQLYADDAVLYSRSRIYLQRALKTLEEYSATNGMTINVKKTKAMKFGNGGPRASGDIFKIYGQRIEMVTNFCYLGIEISKQGTSFARHVTNRIRKAKQAFRSIPSPWSLSLSTAKALFDIKIAPIASYGIELVWESLALSQLEELDKLKASYLKYCLSVHRTSRNRKVYLLAEAAPFTEDLQRRFSLKRTPAFQENSKNWTKEQQEISEGFFLTPGMKTEWWKGAQVKHRHRITRGSIHGFHHLLCGRKGYHEIDENCVCTLCKAKCDDYHLYICPERDNFDWNKAQSQL